MGVRITQEGEPQWAEDAYTEIAEVTVYTQTRLKHWKNKRRCIMKKAALTITVIFLGSIASADSGNESSQLYATRLQAIEVPAYFIDASAKSAGATLSETYIYVSISANGKPVWNSPKQTRAQNQNRFEWPDDSSSIATLLWENGNTVSVRVFLSDDKLQATASAAAVGTAGGAGGGALIGGILAGVFTGGLGAPAGAAIGAAVGGGVGLIGGGATGAISANDRIVFEMDLPRDGSFPLDGLLEHIKNVSGEVHTATIDFKLIESKTPAGQGGLEIGQKYIVRLRSIYLSESAAVKGETNTEEATYYIVLEQGKEKYTFFDDKPCKLLTDIENDLSIITVLKNTGETTGVKVYENDRLRDDLVFSSRVGKVDGKSWSFIGRVLSDDVNDNSYVRFETFGPLK